MLKIQNSRQLLKRSKTATEEPTFAIGSTIHTDGTWITSDIYPGELFLNMEDQKLWFGWEDTLGNQGTVLLNPWTPGTGSCIADFYVTNIHGCSPITFFDAIQHDQCDASGLLSIALGYKSIASGVYSAAFGKETIADNDQCFVVGQFNTAGQTQGTFVVGNGSSSVSRSDLFKVEPATDNISMQLAAYADDAAAGVGGLTAGQLYQTDGTGTAPLNVAGIVMIKQ